MGTSILHKLLDRHPSPRAAWLLKSLLIVGAALVFLLDLLMPARYLYSLLYAPVLMAAILTRSPPWVGGLTCGICLLVILDVTLSHITVKDGYSIYYLLNGILGVVALGGLGLFEILVLRQWNKVDSINQELGRATRSLGESQYLLKIASSVGKVGGWSVNLEDNRVIWSDEVASIHGMKPGYSPTVEEGINFYAPQFREKIREVFKKCVVDGIPYDEELQIINSEGQHVWVRTIANPVRNKSGRIVGAHGAFQDISKRKSLEASLDQSESFIRQMVESTPVILWSADPTGNVDFFGQLLIDFSRVPIEKLIRDNGWVGLLHPDDVEETMRLWREAITSGGRYSTEFRIRRHDGTYRWFLVEAVASRSEEGGIQRWFGCAIDINRQKDLELKAVDAANRLTGTLNSITQAFIICDSEWIITHLNRQAETLIQRSRDEVLGGILWEVVPGAHGSLLQQEAMEAMKSRESRSFEEFVEPLDALMAVTLYPSSDGLMIFFDDVSEKRKAEQRIEEYRHRIDLILDSVGEGIHGVNEKGNVLFENPAAWQMLGREPGEMIGCHLHDEIHHHKSHGGAYKEDECPVYKTLRDGEERHVAGEVFFRKDGTSFPVEYHVYPIVANSGPVTGAVVTFMDVSEKLLLEEQLQRSQRLEVVGHLAGGMAHDFNNLLTVIQGSSDLLVEFLEDNSRLQEWARMISQASRRGADLTHRLLAFSRRQALNPRTLDINRLLMDMLSMLRRTLGEDIEIEMDCGRSLWKVYADASQLESAILNLCLNARDAMTRGGRLVLSTSNLDHDEVGDDPARDDNVVLAVSDTGTGIPKDIIDKVIEPFFTTKEQGKGTGLGLSMVYGFAKQSGGNMEITSEVNVGTTVKLYLPRSLELASQEESHQNIPTPIGGDEKLLLVEDEEMVRNFAQSVLLSLGYQVVCAENADAALAVLEKETDISLLFTDIVMPGGMNGRELAEKAKALSPGLKTLFTSGYSNEVLNHQGCPDDKAPLLHKPYSRPELAAKIREILDT